MRQSERSFPDLECPTRYTVDEARFPGGRERIINKEELDHEPSARIPR